MALGADVSGGGTKPIGVKCVSPVISSMIRNIPEVPAGLSEPGSGQARFSDTWTPCRVSNKGSEASWKVGLPSVPHLLQFLTNDNRVIIANLHPCFHKPAAHRVIEVLENPRTGEQEIHHSIKVSKYLNIEPVQSQALRGQPEPLVCS